MSVSTIAHIASFAHKGGMQVVRLKITYAALTVAALIFITVEARRGGDPSWFLAPYFVTTLLFAAAVVLLAMREARKSGNVTATRLADMFLSTTTVLPPLLAIAMLFKSGAITALLAFHIGCAVTAAVYLTLIGFRRFRAVMFARR